MNADLATTNAWLATLAVVSLLELIAATAALIFVVRLSTRVTAELRDFETRQLTPLIGKLQVALQDMHEVTARVQRADDHIREGVERVGAMAGRVSAALRGPVMPAWALLQGVRAAVTAFRARSRAPKPAHPAHAHAPAPAAADLLDEARLVSEGGHEPANAAFRM
jgi:hypothetical protein